MHGQLVIDEDRTPYNCCIHNLSLGGDPLIKLEDSTFLYSSNKRDDVNDDINRAETKIDNDESCSEEEYSIG